jgi:hypothetical protein
LTVDQAAVQAPPTPPPTINPATNDVTSAAGSFTATVAATGAWSASSNQAWLTIASGASGSGDGAIGYNVAANTGTARQAVITVTGTGGSATLTVNQAGGPPVPPVPPPSISPTAANVAAAGGTGTATVTAPAAWTAASNQTWLTITSGASGTGNGSIGYTAAANTGAARSATITVSAASGTATLTVSQAAGGVTLSFTITKTTSTNPGACEVVSKPTPDFSLPYWLKCRFEASASDPSQITLYTWNLLRGGTSQPIFMGRGAVLTDPEMPCGINSSQSSYPVTFELTVTTTSGATMTHQVSFPIIKTGGC